jgi:hypothetical protein
MGNHHMVRTPVRPDWPRHIPDRCQAPMPLVPGQSLGSRIRGMVVDLKRKRKSIEHIDQVKVVQHFRAFYPDIIIAAIPNGGDRTASERVRLHSEGVLAGMPDLCVLEAKNGFHALFVEMKTKAGVVSAKQSAVGLQLNAKGYRSVVARSAAEAIKTIEDYLNGKTKEERKDIE